jgi:hypothetical protein
MLCCECTATAAGGHRVALLTLARCSTHSHAVCAATVQLLLLLLLLPACSTMQVLSNWPGTEFQRANVDLMINFLDGKGNNIGLYNPLGLLTTNGLGVAPVVIRLPNASYYYVKVAGSLAGNPGSTGYSNFASLGRYTITATYPTFTGTIPPWAPPGPNIGTPYVHARVMHSCCGVSAAGCKILIVTLTAQSAR